MTRILSGSISLSLVSDGSLFEVYIRHICLSITSSDDWSGPCHGRVFNCSAELTIRSIVCYLMSFIWLAVCYSSLHQITSLSLSSWPHSRGCLYCLPFGCKKGIRRRKESELVNLFIAGEIWTCWVITGGGPALVASNISQRFFDGLKTDRKFAQTPGFNLCNLICCHMKHMYT